MKLISLASGAGLWDWAWRDAGADIALQCENAHPQVEILKRAFPEAQLDEDIFELTRRKIENEYHIRNLDETTFIGGLCCQPFSTAGPQLGRKKSTWMCDEIVRLALECQPRFVVVENVNGIVKHEDGLPYLIPQMASAGYSWSGLNIPASAFEAPHERARVFILFYRDGVLVNSASIGRYVRRVDSLTRHLNVVPGIYNGSPISEPPFFPLAYGRPSAAEIDCLRIAGNGVEYCTGFFIAASVIALHDIIYG